MWFGPVYLRRAGHLGCSGAAGEAPRVRVAGCVQHGLALVWIACAVPICTEYGVCSPIRNAGARGCIGEEHAAERAGVLQGPERAGECRAVLQRLELRLAVGLSLLTFGRECDLRIARSDSSADTGLDVIECPGPRGWLRRDAAVEADRLDHEVFRQLAQLGGVDLEMHSARGRKYQSSLQVVIHAPPRAAAWYVRTTLVRPVAISSGLARPGGRPARGARGPVRLARAGTSWRPRPGRRLIDERARPGAGPCRRPGAVQVASAPPARRRTARSAPPAAAPGPDRVPDACGNRGRDFPVSSPPFSRRSPVPADRGSSLTWQTAPAIRALADSSKAQRFSLMSSARGSAPVHLRLRQPLPRRSLRLCARAALMCHRGTAAPGIAADGDQRPGPVPCASSRYGSIQALAAQQRASRPARSPRRPTRQLVAAVKVRPGWTTAALARPRRAGGERGGRGGWRNWPLTAASPKLPAAGSAPAQPC